MKALSWIAVLSFAAASGSAAAHGGGLNAAGCHNDRKTGGYHCHRGSIGSLPIPAPRPEPLSRALPALAPTYKTEAPATEEWLLIVFVFELSGEAIKPQQLVHKAYRSYDACNAGGTAFRGIVGVPEDSKSLSACVPSAWYKTSGWQKEDLE